MDKIKDRILYDAIQTALRQKKTMDVQKGTIVALTGCIVFILAHRSIKGV